MQPTNQPKADQQTLTPIQPILKLTFVCGGIPLLENKFNANKLENNSMINMRTGKQHVEGSAWCMVHAKVAIQTRDANRGGNQLHRVNWGDNT